MTRVQVEIDHAACVMSGQCYYMQPELVRMRDDGYPDLIATDYRTVAEQTLEDLVTNCPAQAIRVDHGTVNQ